MSARHGEAQEVGDQKKKRSLTDAEIAAEYNDSKKVKPRKQRKVMMDEQDLIKPDGLSSILMNFPRQFEHKTYKKNRKDMAKFSLHLITAYQQWANKIVPGTPLEDVLWKIQSMNTKASVKPFLQTMRNEIRNQHLVRIYGSEKAQYFLSQLEDSYGETELQENVSDGSAAAVAEGATPPATTNEPGENTETNASAVPLPATEREIPGTDGQENDMDEEEDYFDMNDMVPVEEEDYADYDMHDTVSVVSTKPTQSKTGVDPEPVLTTNPVPPNDVKNNSRRAIDHFESSDDETGDVRGVVTAKAPRRSILVDSDDDEEEDVMPPKKLEARGNDKVNSVEKDPIADEDEPSVLGSVDDCTPERTENVDTDDIPLMETLVHVPTTSECSGFLPDKENTIPTDKLQNNDLDKDVA